MKAKHRERKVNEKHTERRMRVLERTAQEGADNLNFMGEELGATLTELGALEDLLDRAQIHAEEIKDIASERQAALKADLVAAHHGHGMTTVALDSMTKERDTLGECNATLNEKLAALRNEYDSLLRAAEDARIELLCWVNKATRIEKSREVAVRLHALIHKEG